MHDLVVRGGTVVDGTGSPAIPADVAVDAGRIVEIGVVEDGGHQELDASGRIVMPGVIDPHTHLDAQLCWDRDATPSNLHGVTTVLMGMCGFGIAPCAVGGGDYLLRSLERVEEIPFESSSLGVPFEWRTWPEFLDYLETREPSVNFGGMVPHSSLRYYVMGDRARESVATSTEREALTRELRRSLEAGALGLATSRGPNHVDAFGQPVPSRLADDDELRALVMECAGRPWQVNLESKASHAAKPMLEEVSRYADWTREAGARLTWSPFLAEPTRDVWEEVLAQHRTLNEGVIVKPQVLPGPFTSILSFDSQRISRVVGWSDVFADFLDLDHKARLRRLDSSTVRSAIERAPVVYAEMNVRDRPLFAIPPLYATWSITGTTRSDVRGMSLSEAAGREGRRVGDYLCDLLLSDDLTTELQIPVINSDSDGVAALTGNDLTLIGLGDSGAHVASVTNYSYPTYLLSTLVRDEERLTIENAVRRITSVPAEFFGISGRGTLKAGWNADLCIVHLDRLSLGSPIVRHDLPGGAPRLYRDAVGFDAVVVNGQVTLREGEATGNKPGRAVRAGRLV